MMGIRFQRSLDIHFSVNSNCTCAVFAKIIGVTNFRTTLNLVQINHIFVRKFVTPKMFAMFAIVIYQWQRWRFPQSLSIEISNISHNVLLPASLYVGIRTSNVSIPTSDSTAFGTTALIALTHCNTSISCSTLSLSVLLYIEMKVPLRPAPFLFRKEAIQF